MKVNVKILETLSMVSVIAICTVFSSVGRAQDPDEIPPFPLTDIQKKKPKELTKQCDERCPNLLVVLLTHVESECKRLNSEAVCKDEFFKNKDWANWCRSCDFHEDIWIKSYPDKKP